MTTSLRASARTAVVAAAAAAVAAATLAAVGPAQAAAPAAPAVGSACPAAFPAASLTAGQPVTALTVVSGTTPITITGEYVATLDDGIAPGTDMLLFKMSGAPVTTASGAVDRGIWAGMSGSPVYAADGRLVGAISYGLSSEPSDVAGVTPAADLYRVGSYLPATTTAKVTGSAVASLRASGVSTARATSAMHRLPTPVTVPSAIGAKTVEKIAKRSHLRNVTFRAGGGSGSTSTQKIPVSAGSNLAASYSYGSLQLAGVGTTTAVCGSTVFGFGHPMDWAGTTSMSLHGAVAAYIQRDSSGSFKVANIGAPVGSITQDRLTAIAGKLGAPPAGAKITTTNRFGSRSRTSSTTVPSRDWASTVAATQSGYDGWVVSDGTFGGLAYADRTIVLRRSNGALVTYRRSDITGNSWDITAGAADELAGDIDSLLYNGIEKATLVSATQTTRIAQGYSAYSVSKVKAKQFGRWTKVKDTEPILARRGGYLRLQVTLKRDADAVDAGGPRTKVVTLKLKVPSRKLRSPIGMLTIGGGLGGGDDYFYDEEDEYSDYADAAYGTDDATSLPALASQMSSAYRGNEVYAELTLGKNSKRVTTTSRKATGTLASGSTTLMVLRYGKTKKH